MSVSERVSSRSYCILGNCQANALASTLQVCEEFRRTYQFRRVTPIHRIARSDHEHFLKEILPETDLFLYQPISDQFRGGGFGFEDAIAALGPRTKVISYPSIQFYGYHASARTLPELTIEARTRSKEIFGLAGSELFHYAQIMMAWLLGSSPAEARAIFHEGFAGDDDFVRTRARQSLQQLEESEQRFDVTAQLHPKLSSTYRQRMLFWSPRHPKGELLADIALIALSEIGITPTEDEMARLPKRDPLRLPRYPMQDFLRYALELEFEGSDRFRSRDADLSLEDMIEGYYEIYQIIGRPALETAGDQLFSGLESWRRLREQGTP